MTLARISATGRGRIAARIVIEGLATEFVSTKAMERTTSDGRTRVSGLATSGMVIGASADMMRAKISGATLDVKIRDLDRIAGKEHGRISAALMGRPGAKRFLSATLTSTATTATVSSTTGLSSSGVAHIGTEAIGYTGKTATTLTGLTRGIWQTVAQTHYVADGRGLRDALVSDAPESIEGRRCYLYLYGDGDSPQGDGSLRWQGVIMGNPSWDAGEISFSVDSMARLLEQKVGGELAGTLTIRGIHYTQPSPIVVEIVDFDSATTATARVRLAGFWETQENFCSALTTEIAAALTVAGISLGTGGSIVAEPGIDSWALVYTAPSSSPHTVYASIQSQLDDSGQGPGVASGDWTDSTGTLRPYGDVSWTPVASARYWIAVAAPVPRGSLGSRGGWDHFGAMGDPDGTSQRVYFGGLALPTAGSALHFDQYGDDSTSVRVRSVDTSTRSALLQTAPASFTVLDKSSTMTLGVSLGLGSVIDMAETLISDSPTLVGSGAMPLVTSSDLSWTADLASHVAETALCSGRGFFAFDELTLGELIEPELITAGAYQRMKIDGSIEWALLRPALETDAAAYEIDDSAAMQSSIARGVRGVLGSVLYRMSYSPSEDEWSERTVTYSDVQATSATRTTLQLEIARKSTSTRGWYAGDDWSSFNRDTLIPIVTPAFAAFGAPLSTVTAIVDARYMDARIGDHVLVSSRRLPSPVDGVSPIVEVPGTITGHSLDIGTGAVTLSIDLEETPFAVYAPAYAVIAKTNVSGNVWDLTLSISPGGATEYDPKVVAGMLMQLEVFDSTSPTIVQCSVTSVSSSTVRVTTSAVWTPSTSEWVLRMRTSSSYASTSDESSYAWVGSTTAILSWSDVSEEAKVFA